MPTSWGLNVISKAVFASFKISVGINLCRITGSRTKRYADYVTYMEEVYPDYEVAVPAS